CGMSELQERRLDQKRVVLARNELCAAFAALDELPVVHPLRELHPDSVDAVGVCRTGCDGGEHADNEYLRNQLHSAGMVTASPLFETVGSGHSPESWSSSSATRQLRSSWARSRAFSSLSRATSAAYSASSSSTG